MTRDFTDMMGRVVSIPYPPKRIVSVVPSQTELLHDLGLEEEVIGITKFCVHPETWFRGKTRVGGTKQLHINKIRGLQPDLILANKEENTREQIEELASEFPVWISDIQTIAQGMEMIEAIGDICDKRDAAREIITTIQNGFAQLPKAAVPKTVAYFIWYKPWMSVGRDTFISDMIEAIGWKNVFARETRYPEITPGQLAAANPGIVLLSSEPYPFKDKHVAEIRAILPGAEVMLVDGEMFSWYGSRMKYAGEYMKRLSEPGLED